MRLVGIADGTVAIRLPPEDFTPVSPVPVQDVLNAIQETFQFLSVTAGNPGEPTIFQQGAYRQSNAEPIAVYHIFIVANGCIISASNTTNALLIFEHMKQKLSNQFGYKYDDSRAHISYKSAVVVEFDLSAESKNSKISQALNVVSKYEKRSNFLRRITFSSSDIERQHQTAGASQSPFDQIENIEFLLERRIGVSVDANRYYSVAPTTTDVHLQMLDEIEHNLF